MHEPQFPISRVVTGLVTVSSTGEPQGLLTTQYISFAFLGENFDGTVKLTDSRELIENAQKVSLGSKVTQFVGQERYDWISQQMEKYWKRRRRAAGLYLLTAFESFFLIPIIVVLPFDARGYYAAAILVILLVTLFGASRLAGSSEKLLPSVEDRVLFRLKPSLTSLRVYARDWNESDRKNALSSLRRVANNIDRWSFGNLKFLRDNLENVLNDFKKNFRGRVLLAVERADKLSVPDLLLWLSNFQNVLDMEDMNKASLETWNQFLSQPSPTDSAVSRFPYQTPRQNILRRIASQWFQAVVVLSVPVVPIVSGLFVFYLLHAPVGDASIVAATVFTGMIAVLVGYLWQKGSKS